jgi:3-phytase
VSDQQVNAFRLYTREGGPEDPHEHRFVKSVPVAAMESDGSEVTAAELSEDFPGGLFVAMSTDRTFHFYAWEDLMGYEGREKSNN